MVGMVGGPQPINLSRGCPTGSVIHEIGHAVGLWHEHTREDRDRYIKYIPKNISRANAKHNFKRHIKDGVDIGPYDFRSIMHYGTDAFAKRGKKTLRSKVRGVRDTDFGQRKALSSGDIRTVRRMYSRLRNGVFAQGKKYWRSANARTAIKGRGEGRYMQLSGVNRKKVSSVRTDTRYGLERARYTLDVTARAGSHNKPFILALREISGNKVSDPTYKLFKAGKRNKSFSISMHKRTSGSKLRAQIYVVGTDKLMIEDAVLWRSN